MRGEVTFQEKVTLFKSNFKNSMFELKRFCEESLSLKKFAALSARVETSV
jgi:hypothetical protein